MSLAIRISTVKSVLLAGTWHDVNGTSFDLDSYEFMDDDRAVHGGGQSGVCAVGFSFRTTNGATLYGPLTAIEAVSNKSMQTAIRPSARRKGR
jgi:hypothetical protein